MTTIVDERRWERRDTAANWSTKNPVLGPGEIGMLINDDGKILGFKIGDNNSTAWNDLPFFSGNGNGRSLPQSWIFR